MHSCNVIMSSFVMNKAVQMVSLQHCNFFFLHVYIVMGFPRLFYIAGGERYTNFYSYQWCARLPSH